MKMKWSARNGTTGLCCATKNWSLRTPEQTSLNRVKAFCENVYHFFRNLDSVLETHPFGPSSIWNMDEIGFSTVPSRMGKIISLKEVKRVDQITSAERSSLITLAFAVNAAENPSVTFLSISEKKNEPALFNICIEGKVGFAKEGRDGCSKVNSLNICIILSNTIIHRKVHQHCSFLTIILLTWKSIEAIDLVVTMLLFPPHCSHRLQPLNVSVYGPVKGSYNKLHNAWIRENAGKALDIAHISMLMATLLRGATPENIVVGFKTTLPI